MNQATTQTRLDFADGPGIPRLPKTKPRRRLPAKRKGWHVTPEAMEILRGIKAREKARLQAEAARE